MNKVLVIVGPTAVGKTSFSIKVAKAIDSEIISGDSIQIYKGFNIGSGKIKEEEKEGIVHHLIDYKEHDELYSVADFQKDGRKLIEDITSRNKLPIVCGGTGLYIKALVEDYEFKETNQIDNPYDELTNEQIYQRLKEVDPKSLEKIHINNRRRLVRALNIYEQNKISKTEIEEQQEHKRIYDVLIIGITDEREAIYNNISLRVNKMFEEGLEEEIKNLLASGCKFTDQPFKGIGYKEFEEYINGNISIEEVKELIIRNSKHYAKRQYTWFNNKETVEWFNKSDLDRALTRIKEWVSE